MIVGLDFQTNVPTATCCVDRYLTAKMPILAVSLKKLLILLIMSNKLVGEC